MSFLKLVFDLREQSVTNPLIHGFVIIISCIFASGVGVLSIFQHVGTKLSDLDFLHTELLDQRSESYVARCEDFDILVSNKTVKSFYRVIEVLRDFKD